MTSDREKELLERIRQLEELNSALQDKLDLIYEVVAPEDDYPDADADAARGFVNIKFPNN